MAAYSINPCDRGSIMNNSTVTQRPEWHFTLVAWERDNATVGASLLLTDRRNSDVGDASVFREEIKSVYWSCCCLTLI